MPPHGPRTSRSQSISPLFNSKKGNLFDVILCTLVETGLCCRNGWSWRLPKTSLLENQEAHLATIRQLKNLGITMALDDFGTGYSSVTYRDTFSVRQDQDRQAFTTAF